MAKKTTKCRTKKAVVEKGPKEDKVARVMREFKDGTLKDRGGNVVTSREQAIAIAMSEAGVSTKELEKAEMMAKVRTIRKSLEAILTKEQARDENIKSKVVDFFRDNPNPNDEKVHQFAERNGLKPAEIENYVYGLLSSLLSQGMSAGGHAPVNDEELKKGIKVEMEHTTDKAIAEKIARDHLAEIPDYYTRLAAMEKQAK